MSMNIKKTDILINKIHFIKRTIQWIGFSIPKDYSKIKQYY